jgi:hypothetical protein
LKTGVHLRLTCTFGCLALNRSASKAPWLKQAPRHCPLIRLGLRGRQSSAKKLDSFGSCKCSKSSSQNFVFFCQAADGWSIVHLDSNIISALRTVLDDFCGHLPASSVTARTLVASTILEAARSGQQTYDDLKEAGLQTLKSAPTMWR